MPGSFSRRKKKKKLSGKHILGNINIYQIFILLIIFCIYQYGSQKICGFSLYPDEFGYWASAANAVGYDWSEVASLGSYYSFGYSLILIPLLKWMPDGVAAYRAAIFVNMLFMCGGVFLLQGICKKMFPEINKLQRTFIGGIAALYPAWTFYMQMTMTEALLFFMFALVVYLFLLFVEKPKVWAAALLAASLIYIYCVHMRTVGVVIACVMACLLWGLARTGKMKQLLIMIGLLALLGCVAFLLKEYTVDKVFSYADEETLAINDYGKQWEKFKDIFTFAGMIELLKGIMGKLYYLGLASFGFFYWAFGWCLRETFKLPGQLVKRKRVQLKQWGALLLLLATVGEVLISSIYMHNPSSIDRLVYGRYSELLIPALMAVGAAVMIRSQWTAQGTLGIGILSGGMTMALLNMIETAGLEGFRGYHTAGISYLLNEEDFNVFPFFTNTWLLGTGVTVLICILVWFSRKWPGMEWLLAGVLLIEVAAGLQISDHYTYKVNVANFENMVVIEAVRENIRENERLSYLNEGKTEAAQFLQMQFPEKSVHVITEEELEWPEQLDRLLIRFVGMGEDEGLLEIYEKKVKGNTFSLYYNQS